MLTTATQTSGITRALKSYTTLPKAIASRTLTEITDAGLRTGYNCYGIYETLYAIEGSDMVLLKTVQPESNDDGYLVTMTRYKLFANRTSFSAYKYDTNAKPLVVRKNLKKWARNLKFAAEESV